MSAYNKLQAPQPPRLPNPPSEYSASYFDAFSRTLRLYFEQLGNSMRALLGPNGATYLQSAYGEYKSLADQTLASTTTAYVVTFNSTVFENGVTLVSSTRLTAPVEGIYKLAVNLQFSNANVAVQDVDIWFRKNGTDVANSRAQFSVPERHGGVNGQVGAEVVQYFEMQPNDYIEVVWSGTSTDLLLEYLAPAVSPTRPAAASATASMIFVSAFTTL